MPDPDMATKTRTRVDFLHVVTLTAGKSVQVIVDGVTVYREKVPAGKKWRGKIKVAGPIQPA